MTLEQKYCIALSGSFRRYLFLTAVILMPYFSAGQQIRVEARADTNAILIGKQFHLFLEVTQPKLNMEVGWPAVADTFSGMEVILRSAIDTVAGNPDSMTRRQAFTLTSFDSGYHVIPPFTFAIKSRDTALWDSLATSPLLITVNTIQVDTTLAIKEIKSQVDVPYTWRDFLPWILAIIILAVLILLIRYFLSKRKKIVKPVKAIPLRPAHEIALEALHALQSAKLWQSGNHKSYHSALSDIVRTFIENRWQVNAMEMTTDEIIHEPMITQLEPEQLKHLRYLLSLADQVKFAKMIPIASENEECITYAFEFVEVFKLLETGKETVV